MAVDASFELQTAIYSALVADGTLATLITGVYDFVPQDTAYPYVTIGEDDYSWWGAMQLDGGVYSVTINTWSRAEGRKECKQIMQNIARILHNGSLTVSGNTHISTRLDFQETFREEDEFTYHGVQRYTIYLHE